MARQPSPRTPAIGWRLVALAVVGVLTGLIGGCNVDKNPYQLTPDSPNLTNEQEIALIDRMRANGSFEAAHERLTDTARVIAERIAAAVPGQTWKFTDDPNVQEIDRGGSSCKDLTGDIARRPSSDSIKFGTVFSAEGFKTATDIVRQEAAPYGATTQSSLFNESAKRDYVVQGNGYAFNVGQIKFATLTIDGDCFLLQNVLDLPPGQLPPEPPIIPTTTPT